MTAAYSPDAYGRALTSQTASGRITYTVATDGGTNGLTISLPATNTVLQQQWALSVHQPAPRTIGATLALAFYGDSQQAPDLGIVTYPDQVTNRLFLNRQPFTSAGVAGETSAQILTRFQAASSAVKASNCVFDAGRNNFTNIQANIDALKADIASMVSTCTSGRYRIMEILPRDDGTENIGMPKRIALDTLNNDLAALYGSRFVRRLATLQSNDNGSAGDTLDVQRGLIPRSLRKAGDNFHRNQYGHNVECALLVASIQSGW